MTGKPYRLLSEPSLSTRRAPGRRRPIRGEEVGEKQRQMHQLRSPAGQQAAVPGRPLCGESVWAPMTCTATSGSGRRIAITKTIGEQRGTARRGSKAQSNNQRVVRGGSWLHIPQVLRSASRYGDTTADRSDDIGFRVGRAFIAP
jgi:formylglycine-generating enzyme required for sulfatase activity